MIKGVFQIHVLFDTNYDNVLQVNNMFNYVYDRKSELTREIVV